jgi:O-antigen/teichoic acid export membrane protein
MTSPVIDRRAAQTQDSELRRLLEKGILGDGLKAKVFRGGLWLGSGSALEQAARFARNIILTHMLAPEAFGTMAIVLSATSILTSLTEVGVKEGLIQEPNGSDGCYLNAAWWLSLARATSLALVLFAAAPYAAIFYGNHEITALLRVSSISLILGGALSPRAYVAVKEMKFGKWAVIMNAGGICGVVITLVLSLFIRDVWALMIGSCAESASRCVASYILCPYRPSFDWDKHAFQGLLSFSRGVFGLSFLNFVFSRADILVLAKLFSPAALGLYTMAVYLVQVPTSLIMNVLSQPLLPALAQVRADEKRVNSILTHVTSLILVTGLPALLFMLFCGRSILALAFGARYADASGPLLAASAVALVNLLNNQITTVFYAKGTPGLHRRAVALMAVTMVIVVYPLCKGLGPIGGQLSALLAVLVGYLLQIQRVRHLTGLRLTYYAKGLPLSVLVSTGVILVGLCARPFAALAVPGANIATGILGCITAYAGACAILFRRQRQT